MITASGNPRAGAGNSAFDKSLLCGAAVMALAIAVPAGEVAAQTVARSGDLSGRVVGAKGGEEGRLVPQRAYRNVVVKQNLKAGDILRTNARGTLAILFANRTKVRLGRNSTMTVKRIARGGPSEVEMTGKAWGRNPRKRSNMRVRTPNATAAIRGTEWYIDASDTSTLLEVFEGEVVLENEFGSVTVLAGQAARADQGQAPVLVAIASPDPRTRLAELGTFDDDPQAVATTAYAQGLLRQGQLGEANEQALDAATLRPYDGETLMVLAETSYDDDGAPVSRQQLDAIERAEGTSPYLQGARAAVSIEENEPGRAVEELGMGSDEPFPGNAANMREGSLDRQALSKLGLDGWARFRGDRNFDPNTGVGYADESLTRASTPFANGIPTEQVPAEVDFPQSGISIPGTGSSWGNAARGGRANGGRTDGSALTNLVLGSLNEPLRVASSRKQLLLSERGFAEGFAGGHAVFGSGYSGFGLHGGFDMLAPGTSSGIALSTRIEYSKADLDRVQFDGLVPAVPGEANTDTLSADLLVGIKAGPSDRIFGVLAYTNSDASLQVENTGTLAPRPAGTFDAGILDREDVRAGVYWSHDFSATTQLTLGGLYSRQDLRRLVDEPQLGATLDDQRNASDYLVGSVVLTQQVGPATLKAGVDLSREKGDTEFISTFSIFTTPSSNAFDYNKFEPYADVYVDLGQLRLHGQVSYFDSSYELRPSRFDPTPPSVKLSDDGFTYKIGAAFSPTQGQWLRATLIRENEQGQGYGLMPVSSVGMQPMAGPAGGKTTNYAVRWDAQWSDAAFTAVGFERQDAELLLFFSPSGLALIDAEDIRIDRISAEANFRLGANAGVRVAYARNASEVRGFADISNPSLFFPVPQGGRVPFVPKSDGEIALTYAIPAPLRATFSASARYIGEYLGINGVTLDDRISVDLGAQAELLDRALLVEAGVTNLLDDKVEQGGYLPSGRVFRIGATFRF
ncbi:FecR domain-containing protein [Paraurantiacibacter namhicola]|uniref:FecR protein n=1 Tax=Paraurantiacibacter namhicola TaxID=645517 RepID=A0A1C7DB90_9SPHN|nr:FecR domain-containing protein [Paraurantiacibacter namhicola]ANU08714.1 FecR protein [Paraurantiacibacter namhicola]